MRYSHKSAVCLLLISLADAIGHEMRRLPQAGFWAVRFDRVRRLVTGKLPLHRVVSFATVAELMSFSRAAERLQVDQSWLSRQIRQLEEQLGFALFARTTRSIALTGEGRMFLDAAKRLASAAEDVNAAGRSIALATQATLHIGVSSFAYWIPARRLILGSVEKDYRINAAVSTAASYLLLQSVLTGDLDVAVVMLCREMDGLDYRPIYKARPGIMIPQEDPLAILPEIRMTDLRGVRLALPAQTIPHSSDREHYPFLQAGVDARWVQEGRLAVSHYAISERICALAYEDQNNAFNGYVFRPIADTQAEIEFGAVRRRGDQRHAVRRFWNAARAVGEEWTSLSPMVA